MGGGGTYFRPSSSPKPCSSSSASFISLKTDQGRTEVLKLRPDVNREREGKKKREQSQGSGRQVEDPGSNMQLITSRVMHFIFHLHSMVEGKGGRGREIEGTWRGS